MLRICTSSAQQAAKAWYGMNGAVQSMTTVISSLIFSFVPFKSQTRHSGGLVKADYQEHLPAWLFRIHRFHLWSPLEKKKGQF